MHEEGTLPTTTVLLSNQPLELLWTKRPARMTWDYDICMTEMCKGRYVIIIRMLTIIPRLYEEIVPDYWLKINVVYYSTKRFRGSY